MNIEPRSHVPIYRQIADDLRAQIGAGVFRTGEGLPSIRSLAVQVRVNHNTVQRAYELLERDGLIRQRRGIGMFVSARAARAARNRAVADATSALREAVRSCVQAGMTRSTIREAVADQLGLVHAKRDR